MRLIIRDNQTIAGEHVANYIAKQIKEFKPTPNKPYFVLGLPTGSSPIPVYKRLVELHQKGEISFKNVITFNMDEYVGIPQDHPESYHTFMFENLFSKVDIDPKNVHILNGNAEDLLKECEKYEEAIKSVGGVDLFLGGIGADGHLAFNEPGSSLASRTRIKTLAYETILANCRFFNDDINAVPKMALTVGVQSVMESKEVILIVTGQSKALALSQMIEGGVNHMVTASALQNHPSAMVVCDEDATSELKVKTVKYFKSIERVQDGAI